MLIPYDIFSNVIPFSDMKTIFNLYRTDKGLRELCLNDNFGKVLIKMRHHEYFNLNAKSRSLDNFLTELTDLEMLDKLQLKLSSSLVDNFN